nr:metalloregulator ArsR/SmtB family transcription factor [Tsukamurella paurometabola]
MVGDNRRCPIPTDIADCPVDEASAQPEPEILAATGDLLRALAAPVRISIVLQLMRTELCVHQLVDLLGVTQPLVSQHLRVLKSAGVVRGERNGREIVYRLVDDHLAHIVVDAVAHATERQGA